MNSKWAIFNYRFSHWMFKWVKDEDGDIGLQIMGVITFIKYKESTLIYFFRNFEGADKWQGYQYMADDYLPEVK